MFLISVIYRKHDVYTDCIVQIIQHVLCFVDVQGIICALDFGTTQELGYVVGFRMYRKCFCTEVTDFI